MNTKPLMMCNSSCIVHSVQCPCVRLVGVTCVRTIVINGDMSQHYMSAQDIYIYILYTTTHNNLVVAAALIEVKNTNEYVQKLMCCFVNI